jgi:hypothetical protein
MSLINDALKRAKQAQLNASATPAPGPRLRPVEPAPDLHRRRISLMLPAISLVAITLAALFGLRLFLKSNPSLPQSPAPAPASRPTGPLVATATPAPAAHVAAESLPPALPPVPTKPPADTAASSAALAVAGSTPSAPTASPGTVAAGADAPATPETASAPKPAPLKLQGILFDPAHPSAMISGHTMFIGDKLGEWRVIAINRESATLVNASQTNLLTLPQ